MNEDLEPSSSVFPLHLLHEDVRTGHACIATFEGPRGLAWVEILGPKGMRPDGAYLVAPVPTLRLWVPERRESPTIVTAANTDFDLGLRAIEEKARPHLHDLEASLLAKVLAVVRAAAKGLRPRAPTVGGLVTQAGTPTLRAWASCLTLGDLQIALGKSVA